MTYKEYQKEAADNNISGDVQTWLLYKMAEATGGTGAGSNIALLAEYINNISKIPMIGITTRTIKNIGTGTTNIWTSEPRTYITDIYIGGYNDAPSHVEIDIEADGVKIFSTTIPPAGVEKPFISIPVSFKIPRVVGLNKTLRIIAGGGSYKAGTVTVTGYK